MFLLTMLKKLRRELIFKICYFLRSILSCDKMNGASIRTIITDQKSPRDIHVYDSVSQPRFLQNKSSSQCLFQNGGCSHLCLSSPVSPYFKCACPTGIKLINNHTCAKCKF